MKRRSITAIIILIVILMTLLLPSRGLVLGQPFPEIHEKLMSITGEEKKVLEKLFVLVQEIEGIEREEEKLALEIKEVNIDITDLEGDIEKEEKAYKKNKDALKEVLKSYQKMGPGSYLEIILNSDNLATLLRRINTLQDITRNTGSLLKSIGDSKNNLVIIKEEHSKNLSLLEEKQKQLEETLLSKNSLRKEIEDYLTSLEDEKEYYQEYLGNLQRVWDEMGGKLMNTVKELSRIISEEELPEDALKLSFSLFRIKGSIDEKVFNDLVKKYPVLPDMMFRFTPGEMSLEFADSNIVLKGKLVILGDDSLEFIVEKGSFYGMPLESITIEELLKDNKLIINLKPVLYGNKLSSVTIYQGYIELTSSIGLF